MRWGVGSTAEVQSRARGVGGGGQLTLVADARAQPMMLVSGPMVSRGLISMLPRDPITWGQHRVTQSVGDVSIADRGSHGARMLFNAGKQPEYGMDWINPLDS